jgi:YD repeat-containing protein
MHIIELKEGQIFEVKGNTGHTYFYDDYGKITEITMQELNVINLLPREDRAKVLREFRWKNN